MKAHTFATKEACDAWCSKTKAANSFFLAGPIHKHNGTRYVQLYQGQHEWLAVNLDDLADVRHDPGYEATVFGWAYIDPQGKCLGYLVDHAKKLPEPESTHPPITQDEILFGDRSQVETYLGLSLSELPVVRLPESDLHES